MTHASDARLTGRAGNEDATKNQASYRIQTFNVIYPTYHFLEKDIYKKISLIPFNSIF